MADAFLRARTEIQARIKKLESELDSWRKELEAFDRVEIIMRRYTKEEPATLTLKPDSGELISTPSVIRRGDLKRQVLDVVLKHDGPVSSTDVERTMLSNGFRPSGKHFDISVVKTLNRLADQGFIEKRNENGRVTFVSKIE